MPEATTTGERYNTAVHPYRSAWDMGDHWWGSHTPIDTDLHWDWRNPLNIISVLPLLALITALWTMFVP